MSLEQAAVEQNPEFSGFDQVLTSGDFAGGSAERDFHVWGFLSTIPAIQNRAGRS